MLVRKFDKGNKNKLSANEEKLSARAPRRKVNAKYN